MTAIGYQISATVFVGKSMGEGNVPLAKKYITVISIYAVGTCLAIFIIILISKK